MFTKYCRIKWVRFVTLATNCVTNIDAIKQAISLNTFKRDFFISLLDNARIKTEAKLEGVGQKAVAEMHADDDLNLTKDDEE